MEQQSDQSFLPAGGSPASVRFQQPESNLSKLQVAVIRQLRKNLKTVEGQKVLREECRHQRRMRHLRGLIWSQMESKDQVDRERLDWLFSLYDMHNAGMIDE